MCDTNCVFKHRWHVCLYSCESCSRSPPVPTLLLCDGGFSASQCPCSFQETRQQANHGVNLAVPLNRGWALGTGQSYKPPFWSATMLVAAAAANREGADSGTLSTRHSRQMLIALTSWRSINPGWTACAVCTRVLTCFEHRFKRQDWIHWVQQPVAKECHFLHQLTDPVGSPASAPVMPPEVGVPKTAAFTSRTSCCACPSRCASAVTLCACCSRPLPVREVAACRPGRERHMEMRWEGMRLVFSFG